MRLLFPLFLLFACGDPEAGEGSPSPSVTDSEPVTCEDSSCVREGYKKFKSGTSDRKVFSFFPEEPQGAPVLFVFHYLGGSAQEIIDIMPVEDAVADGFVVIVPESSNTPATEWEVLTSPDGNQDLELFDALLTSLIEVQGVDPDRVFATGFSAGGLFTSYLTVHRSEFLAATAPYSGGATSFSYQAPVSDIPVMVTWGGPTDMVNGFDFDEASSFFAESLVGDGHLVLSCEHDGGHTLPLDTLDRTLTFINEIAYNNVVPDFEPCERLGE